MPDKNKTKPGSDESIAQTLNQMSLQTYLQEVNAYEQLLNPIQNILQNALGAPLGKPAPEDLGWGPEGKKLAPAMWKIGATPSSWHRPLSPGGSTALSAAELLAFEQRKLEEEEKNIKQLFRHKPIFGAWIRPWELSKIEELDWDLNLT